MKMALYIKGDRTAHAHQPLWARLITNLKLLVDPTLNINLVKQIGLNLYFTYFSVLSQLF